MFRYFIFFKIIVIDTKRPSCFILREFNHPNYYIRKLGNYSFLDIFITHFSLKYFGIYLLYIIKKKLTVRAKNISLQILSHCCLSIVALLQSFIPIVPRLQPFNLRSSALPFSYPPSSSRVPAFSLSARHTSYE